MTDKYGSTGMPARKNTDFSKMKTDTLYMKNGVPCGDMEAVGPRGKGPSGAGGGPTVGGTPMGIHNSFENGIPDAGRENITAEVIAPEHKANVAKSVLDTKEDSEWGGVIAPQEMGANNKFGV